MFTENVFFEKYQSTREIILIGDYEIKLKPAVENAGKSFFRYYSSLPLYSYRYINVRNNAVVIIVRSQTSLVHNTRSDDKRRKSRIRLSLWFFGTIAFLFKYLCSFYLCCSPVWWPICTNGDACQRAADWRAAAVARTARTSRPTWATRCLWSAWARNTWRPA